MRLLSSKLRQIKVAGCIYSRRMSRKHKAQAMTGAGSEQGRSSIARVRQSQVGPACLLAYVNLDEIVFNSLVFQQ